jgi:uncharacterized protein YraI
MRKYAIPLAGALLALFAVPSVAAAANATTTSDLNMRAGPSTSFPVVEVIPDNAGVVVHGCLGDYAWCDVTWRDARGWVSAAYLDAYYSDGYVPLVEYGPRINLPIVTFSFETYWDDYYRGRPWYARRAHWRHFWHHNRDAIRAEHRRERADRRHERREQRADRHERRTEQRHERRTERRQQRHERRTEQRHEKQAEHRQHRRESTAKRRHEHRGNVRANRPRHRAEHRARRAEHRANRPARRVEQHRRSQPRRSMAPRGGHHGQSAARAERRR